MDKRQGEFDDFVAASSNYLLRTAFALTGNRSVAEDLVQDVLERLYVAWPRVEDPRAYAQRALVNRSSNRWRNHTRHPVILLTEAHDRPDVDGTKRTDDQDALFRAIITLPPGQRAVIVLRFLEGLSESETAQTLSCSPGTVKSQTSRAMARLREVLSSEEAPSQRSTT